MNIVHYLSKKNEHTVQIENEYTLGHGESDVSAGREKEKKCVRTINNEVEKMTPKNTDMNIVQQLPRKTTFHLFLTNLAIAAKAQQATLSGKLTMARTCAGTTNQIVASKTTVRERKRWKEL